MLSNQEFIEKLDADIAAMELAMSQPRPEPMTPLQRQVHTFDDAVCEMSVEELLSYCDNNL